jgi:NitT/TauT family transport system substrate-binding protein
MLKRSAHCTVVAALAVGATACGSSEPSGGSSGGSSGEGGLAEVNVSLVSLAGSAPIYVAQEQGCFEDAGLSVTIEEVVGPAAVAALQNGQNQFASLGATVVLTAASQGVPLGVVSARTRTADEAEADEQAFMVMPDSDIEGPEDLSGRTVATQTLGSANTLMARATVDQLGGDSSSIEFIDIPFPDMMAALRSGSVDAAAVSEPFVTSMEEAGAVRLFGIGAEAFEESAPIGVIAALQDYIAENPDQVEAFQEAMTCAVEWIQEDEQRFREYLPTITELTPEQAAAMTLPTFTTEIDEDGLQVLTDALLDQGLIETEPNLSELLP